MYNKRMNENTLNLIKSNPHYIPTEDQQALIYTQEIRRSEVTKPRIKRAKRKPTDRSEMPAASETQARSDVQPSIG